MIKKKTKKTVKKTPLRFGKNKKDKKSKQATIIKGQISINSRGVGFLSWQKDGKLQEDIRIEKERINHALNKDQVIVQFLYRTPQQSYGEVIKIVSSYRNEFVGTVTQIGAKCLVHPDDKKLYTDILLDLPPRDLKVNDKVLVKTTGWQEEFLVGEVVKKIGVAGDNNTEMIAIALEKGFENNFPTAVLNETNKIALNFELNKEKEITQRLDLRKVWTCTIDPVDAKDFDDALSLEKLQNGNWSVGVHIADVTYFVRPNSELDKEAGRRACSVYLVDRTIPMLPEKLSNDLCSLNPQEDKLAFSAIFEITPQGKVVRRKFARSVINSNKRFSYEEAQAVLDQGKGEFFAELNTLNQLAKIFQAEARRKGVIDFNQDEIKIKMDATGKPLSVYLKQSQDTNKMIESFMLLANQGVAEFLDNYENKNKITLSPILYRIHDQPDKEKITNLARLVSALGYTLPTQNNQVKVKDLQKLLEVIEGKNEASFIKTATIRSMAKAIYSTKNIGHYGLALRYYTHFTSPIRRYPDLLIHRILAKYLDGNKVDSREVWRYEEGAKNSTEREIAAAEAERDSIKYKQIELLMPHLNEIRDGKVSGVTEWGLYIEDAETRAEAMVRVKNLTDDFYEFDKNNFRLIGQKTKKKYRLGDAVQFKIVKADLESKSMDGELV